MSTHGNSLNTNPSIINAANDAIRASLPPSASSPTRWPYLEVPVLLKDTPNWVGWKLGERKGKPEKLPFDVKTGRMAKSDDPSTWAPFEQVLAATDVLQGSDYDGPGFELGGTDISGIDFDSAINSEGVIDPYALEILTLLGDPYTEVSPSGTGLHSFVQCAALPEGKRKLSKGHDGIEIYHGKEKGRYFTITGNKILGDGVPTIVDMTLPYWLITQNNNKQFKALWLGNITAYDKDDSKADFALMCRLAVLTQNDCVKMEEYFSASPLSRRDKWTDRADYRQRTIKNAIEANRTGKILPPAAEIEFHVPALDDPDGEYVISPAEGQEDGWFPLGDISLIGGASGTGKTTFMFEMLHKQKQRYPVLGHRTHGYTFQVLAYDRRKNAFARTLRRLKLLPTDLPTISLPLAFGTQAVQGIINQIERMNPIPNIIFIEGLDMLLDDTNKKSVVTPFMRRLQEVGEHFHIALIGSVGAPKTKNGEGYAAKRDRLSGSEAWGRNCETVAVIEFSDEGDGTGPRRELTVLPRNANAENFSLQFEAGRLVPVQPASEEETKIMHDKKALPIDWFRRQAELAKTDPAKQWWSAKILGAELGVSQPTANRHVNKAWDKHYLTKKSGPKVDTKTNLYCWNESPENPLWEEPPSGQEAEGELRF